MNNPSPSETDYELVQPTAYGQTDIGQKRQVNQDQFLIAELNKTMLVSSTSLTLSVGSVCLAEFRGQVLLVADGMGGHAAGEKASSLAIDHLITQLLNSVHCFFRVRAKMNNSSSSRCKSCFKMLTHESLPNPQRTKTNAAWARR